MSKKESGLAWFILIALMLVWGSSFIVIKKALLFFDAMQVGALRVVMAWLVLLPYALKHLRNIDRKAWFYLLVSGFVGSTIPAFMFPLAQKGIDSSLAGVLNSLTPLFTLVLGVLIFRFRSRWYHFVGVLIGLAGAIGLISVSGGYSFSFNISYAVYVVLATICYALNANVIKSNLMHLNPITITSLAFFLVGPPMLVWLTLATPFLGIMQTQEGVWTGFALVAFLGIFGTGLALMGYNKLIHLTTPLFASSVTYLMPLVALFWGILDGEVFRVQYLYWIAMILIGVALANMHRTGKNRLSQSGGFNHDNPG